MNLTDYNTIQELLRRHNFRFSKSMGQNFLTSADVVERIADSAGLDASATVVEVGPGIGCLTRELSERAGKVLSYELDTSLMPILAETLAGCENVEVIFRDFMKEKKFEGTHFCANIPYNITSPLLTKVVECPNFEDIVVMVQKEVALRICAMAGEKDYSSFGILCQWYTEPRILFDVTPDNFVPQPKVTSSVLKMVRRKNPPVKVEDEKKMFSLIRAAFNQRRKTLLNAVSSAGVAEKQALEQVLQSLNLDVRIRGEALSIREFAAISDALGKSDIKK